MVSEGDPVHDLQTAPTNAIPVLYSIRLIQHMKVAAESSGTRLARLSVYLFLLNLYVKRFLVLRFQSISTERKLSLLVSEKKRSGRV